MAALDSSIVNVSIPAIMRSFGSRIGEVEWVVSAYMMGFAVVMPMTHWLTERLGFFRLHFAALAVFTVGSLLCGIATNLPLLVAARVIQAAGGGMLTPLAMAILSSVFPAEERGKVLGLWGLGVLVGPALGPTLGGLLTERFGWPWIFLVNLPVGATGLWLAWRFLRDVEPARQARDRFDWPGFASLSVCLVVSLYAISLLEQGGNTLRAGVFFAIGAAAGALFVRTERRSRHPLIRLGVLRNQALVACLLVSFSRSAALFGGIFLLPFLLQDLMGYGETETGLLMLPGAIAVGLLMPLSGRWFDRHGGRGLTVWGLLLLTGSMVAFALLGAGSGTLLVVTVMTMRGAGLGLLLTPVAAATVNSVPARDVPLASSLGTLSQQIGGSIGVANLAVLHQLARRSVAGSARSPQAIEHFALQTGFLAAAALTAIAIIPALYMPRVARRPAEETPLLEAG